MEKRTTLIGIMLMLTACGTDMTSSSKKKAGTYVPVSTTTGTVLGINATLPASYTFLDTPNANVCVDAFARKGIVVPDNAVARTLSATSIGSEGIAISDTEVSAVPVMNIVYLDAAGSNMMYQFLNPNGLYCIVKNTAIASTVRIQRSCAAAMTEIEPINHTVVNGSLSLCAPMIPTFSGLGSRIGMQPVGTPTTGAYSSTIQELPCIP